MKDTISPAQQIGVLNSCLAHIGVELHRHLHTEDPTGATIRPSNDHYGQEALCYPHKQRWRTQMEAGEWASNLLCNHTLSQVHVYRHAEYKDEQIKQLFIMSGLTAAYKSTRTSLIDESHNHVPRLAGESMPAEEVPYLLDIYSKLVEPRLNVMLWKRSFISLLNEGFVEPVKKVLAKAEESSVPFFTYNKGWSRLLVNIGVNFAGYPVNPTISDAALLMADMKFGARTRVFIYQSVEGVDIGFCYMRPLLDHPPVRVEFPADYLNRGGYYMLLEKVMAFFILNPFLIS